MLMGEMAISLDHLERSVAQHLRDFGKGGSAHGQVARRCMSQIMETEVLELGVSKGVHPSLPREGSPSRQAIENLFLAAVPFQESQGVDRLERNSRQRQTSPVSVLRVLNDCHLPFEVLTCSPKALTAEMGVLRLEWRQEDGCEGAGFRRSRSSGC